MHLADAFIQSDLQLHSGYTFFISMCVPWESNPQPFALLTQCSTTEPHRNTCVCPCLSFPGADQAYTTVLNNLQLTQSQVEHIRQKMLEAERQLKVSRAEDSERLPNALSTAIEDEDVPDAYLQED